MKCVINISTDIVSLQQFANWGAHFREEGVFINKHVQLMMSYCQLALICPSLSVMKTIWPFDCLVASVHSYYKVLHNLACHNLLILFTMSPWLNQITFTRSAFKDLETLTTGWRKINVVAVAVSMLVSNWILPQLDGSSMNSFSLICHLHKGISWYLLPYPTCHMP